MAKSDEQKAAERGAKWLDQHEKGWAISVDLNSLDMENGDYCILGQCFGDYFDTLQKFRPDDSMHDERWARAHGFNAILGANGKERGGSYERLALSWAPLVAVRQVRANKRGRRAR